MTTKPTPETDAAINPLININRLFKTSQKLERERDEAREQRDEAREEVATMEIRHAAVMLHTQSIVDEANQFREQRDRLAEALRPYAWQCSDAELAKFCASALPSFSIKAQREMKRRNALQSLTPKP
jgi:chromosome segregation ATPase